MASAGEIGWLQRRRIRVMAVAHLAVPQQDHDPRLLAEQIRRIERSVDGISSALGTTIALCRLERNERCFLEDPSCRPETPYVFGPSARNVKW
jgi:hypothetical protein